MRCHVNAFITKTSFDGTTIFFRRKGSNKWMKKKKSAELFLLTINDNSR
jgi:hypothetical protein